MSRTVAYVRVSTDKQDTANQLFEIEKYLARTSESYDEAVEETISGTKSVKERKLGRLIQDLAAGDTLIVSETSRISRKLNEIFSTILELIDKGVTVIAVKQNFRFGDDIQSKVVSFAFALASEIERDLISSRTREALQRRKADGVVLGRKVGTTKPEWRKLHGKDEQIIEWIQQRVPKAVMARMLGVNRDTVRSFISQQNLEYEVRRRQLEQAMKEDGTWKEK